MTEKISKHQIEHNKTMPRILSVRKFLIFYITVSVILSATIFLRLAVTVFDAKSFDIMGLLNVVFFDLYYYVAPIITVFLFLSLNNKEKNPLTKTKKILDHTLNILLILSLSFILLFIDYTINHPLLFLLVPLFMASLITIIFWKKLSDHITIFKKSLTYKVVVLLMIVIFLLPYLSVFLGNTYVSLSMNEMQNDSEKIQFISDYVMDAHTSVWGPLSTFYNLHRVGNNFLKFWLVGVSACGDMAETTISFIDSLKLDSRQVNFPGEDHAFVEVFIDGEWLVVDPGYRIILVTQRERGQARLKEMGGLSYVVANIYDDPIDLTADYVMTDQITIKVLQNGQPLPNANVKLKHEFHGDQFGLPSLKTDENGILIINLGSMNYTNPDMEPAEPFYLVWVNGENTHTQITSSGSGKSIQYEIQLN